MEQLVEMCKEGHFRALEEFMSRIRCTVFRRALFYTKNSCEAEDLTVEALIRIYRKVDSIKDPATLNSWIDRVVRNVWIDIWRSEMPHRSISLESLEEWDLHRNLSLNGVDETASLQTRAEQSENARMLNKAVGSLPASLYSTVVMFYCEDRQYEEISSTLGIPIGTVKSRLNRARAVLRNKLAPHFLDLLS